MTPSSPIPASLRASSLRRACLFGAATLAATVCFAATSTSDASPTAVSAAPGPRVTHTAVTRHEPEPAAGPVGSPSRSDEARDAAFLAGATSAITAKLGDLEQCYTHRLTERPELPAALGIHWEIDGEGRMVHGCLDQVTDPVLAGCVNALIEGTPYPAPPSGAASVRVEFQFAPSA